MEFIYSDTIVEKLRAKIAEDTRNGLEITRIKLTKKEWEQFQALSPLSRPILKSETIPKDEAVRSTLYAGIGWIDGIPVEVKMEK